MNVIAQIVQCPNCLRYVCGGAVLALSFGESAAAVREDRLHSAPCGLPDCDEVVGTNSQRDRARLERRLRNRRERHAAAEACKSAIRPPPAAPNAPRLVRLPYADPEIDATGTGTPLTQNLGEVFPAPGGTPETARTFGQRDFEASGAADSQNAKLAEFFNPVKQPHNFRKWFKASFLEEMSGSRRMNNRAVDLRRPMAAGGPGFLEAGLYLDNCMLRDAHSDKLASYYGLFPIEECKSLSEEQKLKLTTCISGLLPGNNILPPPPKPRSDRDESK